jgi:hypothetical protein
MGFSVRFLIYVLYTDGERRLYGRNSQFLRSITALYMCKRAGAPIV